MRRQVEQEEKKKEAALKQAQELERLYQQRLEEYKKQLREVNLGVSKAAHSEGTGSIGRQGLIGV